VGVLLRVSDVPLTVAGRTDAGVHATGQVVSYPGPPVPLAGLNALLPADVAALECCSAEPGFDARRDATSRAYCYRVLPRPGRSPLLRGRVLHWPHSFDVEALEACAAALVGTHDFTAFTPTETDHVRFSRDVYSAFWRWAEGPGGGRLEDSLGVRPEAPLGVRPEAPLGVRPEAPLGVRPEAPLGPPNSGLLEFWIEADAFMRHMNRVLVGTMLEVSLGRRSLESFRALLDGQPRSVAGPTAPAHGLYLAGVGYGERVLPSHL
jgi:tRNA pseudouridine38-40 synthase